MAVLPAGEARRYYQAHVVRRKIVLVCAAIIFVTLLGVEAKAYSNRSKDRAESSSVAVETPKTFAAKQAVDVNTVASAVGQFVSANGSLPSSLYATPDGKVVLCGSFCDASLYAIGGFEVYQAAGVHIVPYQSNLRAPDTSTIDLVPGAKCGSDGALSGPNTAKNAMAVLYVASTDKGTEPRCIVL